MIKIASKCLSLVCMTASYKVLFIPIFIIVSITVQQSYAQKQNKQSTIAQQSKRKSNSSIRDWSLFIPKGYSILDKLSGDLNMDNRKDLILVLKRDGEDSLSSIEKPIKRKVLILLMQEDNSWKLECENENVVYFYRYDTNFQDAFLDIALDQAGQFSIHHYGGFAQRWGRTCRFKYNKVKQKWYLVKDEYSSFSAINPEENSTEKEYTPKDFGKIDFEHFDVYKEIR